MGCGGGRGLDRPEPPPEAATDAQRARLADALQQLEAGARASASGALQGLLDDPTAAPLHPYAALHLARLRTADDPDGAQRSLDALSETHAGTPLGEAATLYAGVAAAGAARCDAALVRLDRVAERTTGRALSDAEWARARCAETPMAALEHLEAAVEADETRGPAARSRATALLSEVDGATMAAARGRFAGGPLGEVFGATTAPAAGAPLGVLLPLTGRGRPLGERLADTLAVLTGAAGGPAPTPLPAIRLVDANQPATAFEALSRDGVGVAVAVLDRENADAVFAAAAEHGIALLALTLAPLPDGGAVWRVLHTPPLIARTAAGAGLARGGRRAAVVHPDDGYGRTLARWFAAAWEGGGGTVVALRPFDPAATDWPAVAQKLAALEVDTLFVPAGPAPTTQLVTHLARNGLWSRARKQRFVGEQSIREVVLVGVDSWYEPDVLRSAGRYFEGALVAVPWARETAGGAELATRLEAIAGRGPSAWDAYLADALHLAAEAIAAAPSDPARALLQLQRRHASAGLDLTHPEAASALYVLEVRDGTFVPFQP
jgi:ABC-type branched-subunit amino acid transport system substrate-binding protein